MKVKKNIIPYILLLPMFLIMAIFVFYPMVATFTYSLKQWKLTMPNNIKLVGIENYIRILQGDSFWYSFKNTVFLLVVVVTLTTIIGIAVALFLNIDGKGSGILLALAILPWALPPYVNGILWKFVFHSGYGFMNQLLLALHLIEQPIEWLGSRWSLLLVVSFVASWRSIPFTALICFAGRRALPQNIYESAKIDGGSSTKIFFEITLPLMKPFIAISVTSVSITAMNIFDEIIALSGYSDLGKSLLVESYLITFSFLDFGKGSALTYIIMFFASILGVLYLYTLNKEVEY